MRHDSRLSRVLHILIHMGHSTAPLTSEAIAIMLQANPVVIRRTLGALREHGLVESQKGHGGGWVLPRPLHSITLDDVYQAIGEPELFAIGLSQDSRTCLIEKNVNSVLKETMNEAEAIMRKQFKRTTLDQLAKSFKN